MRVLFSVIFSFLLLTCFGQERYTNDVYIANITPPFNSLSPKQLAVKLTSRCRTDLDKVRSITEWIAGNISYNMKPQFNSLYASSNINDDANDTGALKPLSERVAETVLRKRVAFCDGYARLFQTLCEYAGLQVELISGYAKTGYNKHLPQTFRTNHRWNAVKIDSTWRLIDVTWASGYVNGANEYVQHFDDEYFLSSPEEFIGDHYPEDVQWTLLSSPPTFDEYIRKPLPR